MSRFSNQQETPAVSYPPSAPYVTAPPPMGYPSKDVVGNSQQTIPDQTTTRGDGFWKGCCAALCCCCVLDWCF